jgi:hypothetical protein
MQPILLLGLFACVAHKPPVPVVNGAAVAPPSAPVCVGVVDPVPAGFVESAAAPPAFAIGAPGTGALCEGKVFTVEAPVRVYRAYSASYETSKRAGPKGAYWSLQAPTGDATGFRTAYAVCPEWNDLDMLATCTVDLSATVVVGPGQSATCADGTVLAASAVNQVLVVRPAADSPVPVGDCTLAPLTWGGAAAN